MAIRRPYAGATKLVTLAEARKLGLRWVLQEKKDGEYARVTLNSQGRVDRVFSRKDRELGNEVLAGIRGAFLGRPHAELVGELEAHTEAGNAAFAKRGHRLLHLFDCLHDGERSLTGAPYGLRRDALCRMQAEVVNYGKELPWFRDQNKDAHERKTGRYASQKPKDWRVAPILPQAPLAQLDALWEEIVKDGDGEGLVAVNLDARVGAPASKLKIKPYETLDCEVVQVARTMIVCSWVGNLFSVGRGKHEVAEGDIVEIRHAGWYQGSATPRFPALVRVRLK